MEAFALHDAFICTYSYVCICTYFISDRTQQTQSRTHMLLWERTGWRRPIGCLQLQVIFRKRATNHRSLSRKMTHKDKACYASWPPSTRFMTHLYVCLSLSLYIYTLICMYLYVYICAYLICSVWHECWRGIPMEDRVIHIWVYISWWVLQHCTGSARLIWGRPRVHGAFVYSDWFVCYASLSSLLPSLTLLLSFLWTSCRVIHICVCRGIVHNSC